MLRSKLLLLACLGVIIAVNANDDDIKSPAIVLRTARPRYHVDILRIDPIDDTLHHVCDGAILDSHHLITAAHCVYDESITSLRVRSGSDIAPPDKMPHYDERLFHKVNKAMYPADFVNYPCRHHEHDVAIVKVARAFDLAYDALYKQVNLPEVGNDYEGYKATLSGYADGMLNTLQARIVSNEDCSRNATSIVTRGNVCAVVDEDAVYVNNKISGSPLVHDNAIVGIMNSPSSCGGPAKSGFKCGDQSPRLRIYTRVSIYMDFVEKVLRSQASSDIVYRS